ncbi:MAG TPA: hypothetical protein VFG21_10175 [Xanthomonadaceae bacterium]|nr:hypothetical protein [Xanthomonadaceae bacterium]
MMDLPLGTAAGLATALGIGLLVGVEREHARMVAAFVLAVWWL